jgi:5'-methylthioadenosine phosphorylase
MDIIGMTTSPEAFLAREAGICYTVMAHITDYDVWHESEGAVTVEMVVKRFNANINLARKTLTALLPQLAGAKRTCDCENALADAVLTAKGHIPDETREQLRPLVEPFL